MREYKMGKYFEKIAEDTRPEAGIFAKHMAINRAMRSSDSGFGKVIASDELIGSRFKNSLSYGFGVGGPIGAITGGVAGAALSKGNMETALLGTLGGAFAGVAAGAQYGGYVSDKNYLAKRGINLHSMGFSADLTPEAKTKYLDSKYKGGGYGAKLETNG